MAFQDPGRLDTNLSLKFRNYGVEMRGRVLVRVKSNPHAIDNSNKRHRPHKSSTSRAGSSRLSFTRTRNITASRPSTMR